jgi:hypothetical protein
MLSARRNVVAVQTPSVYECADSGVSRFGFIHHGLAWQCRLDATGDSWLRLAHERKARSLIPADRIEKILGTPDDDAEIADAIIAEFLRRGSRHLPHELVAHVRGFTIAWVRDAQRIMRRRRQRAGASSTAAPPLTMLADTVPALD